ncbi:response regulator [Celeribacter sp.]|uniref:response regulator n=1 Tax=Celeribacter sp. TaxID=1890673 RepID=UPI003A8F6721
MIDHGSRDQPDAPQNSIVPLGARETRVLIVDDSEFDCMNIERQCRRTNLFLSVDTANDVEGMRKALDETKYDVIFVDYHLAFETGLEAREVIREHPTNKSAATIMITGEVCHEVAVSAIKNGCHDYVAKGDLDALSIEMMMASATEQLENHTTRVLRAEMDAIHDRTMGAVTKAMQDELSDDRIISLLVRALGQVSAADGLATPQDTDDETPLIDVDDTGPNFFVFK